MGEDIFIQQVHVNHVRHITDFAIPLSGTERKHLILTGINGSGKTSVLNALADALHVLLAEETAETGLSTSVMFNNASLARAKTQSGDFIIAFFGARRADELNVPKGISAVDIKPVYAISENAGSDFIQYIVNLKADRSFAGDNGETEEVQKIDRWFEDFEKALFVLFDKENTQLEFDRKNYNFNILEPGKEPYSLNQLSDGYSAILTIVTELIMRMEKHREKNYDMQGIVLIDEIETHLHIALQKKILPFLTAFFPRIQFIVTTHSPFVLSSIDNAVICDLDKYIVIQHDLSVYSSSALVEDFFEADQYSNLLKNEVAEYEQLMSEKNPTAGQSLRLSELEARFAQAPALSEELRGKLQQIKLNKFNPAG
jgi:predicted ATPase